MKDTITLLYIDDRPETSLARYLDQEYSHEKHATQYSDLLFKPQDGYESLLTNPKVKSADVIFVDSRLFENRTAVQGKFTKHIEKINQVIEYIEAHLTDDIICADLAKIATLSEYEFRRIFSFIIGIILIHCSFKNSKLDFSALILINLTLFSKRFILK